MGFSFNRRVNTAICLGFLCGFLFGDTVWVNTGTYSSFPASIQSGTQDNWKVYAGRGQEPVDVSVEPSGDLNISGVSCIIFQNIAFGQKSGMSGGENVYVYNSHHVYFKKCKFFSVNTGSLNPKDPQTGDLLKYHMVNDVLIEDCEFVNENSFVYGSCDQYVDFLNVHDIVFRNNYFHDMFFSKSACVQFKGGSYNVLIEKCVFDSIGEGSALRLGGSTGDQWIPNPSGPEGWNITVRNNVFINCPEQPIDVYNGRDIRVHNNTFIGSGGAATPGTWESGAGIFRVISSESDLDRAKSDSVWFINNLIWNPKGDLRSVADSYIRGDGAKSENIWIENNLIWNGNGSVTKQLMDINGASSLKSMLDNNVMWNYWKYAVSNYRNNPVLDPTNTAFVKNNFITEPQMVVSDYNASSFDHNGIDGLYEKMAAFALLGNTSHAIDAGQELADVTHDFNGNARIGKPDIGAFEFGSTSKIQ
ncbi:MAG: right-handed parallel beta-helix repeat-containing protein, partial [bacterium]